MMSSLEEYRRINTRLASVATIGGFRPTRDPLASHFGLVPVALPGEEWPEANGAPLSFVCQWNLAEVPHVPEVLRGIALMTVFIDDNCRHLGGENGEGWLIRAYDSLDSLRPLMTPIAKTVSRGFEVRYDVAEDYPDSCDPERRELHGFDRRGVHLENIYRTKIGGYASCIQSEPWWYHIYTPEGMLPGHPSRPRYAFQFAHEDKVGLYWGDIAIFGRGTAPGCESQWFQETQCW